ncbi:Retrovirus-related Pol polyprotein from transposon TNT 1-94 [Vitis vinifera]|uniref:Retrovirus-related Pol polyprotein from transposon TNT 1-94 n=1 Tax=Vitis vinifera TaxID=29760 RepID=A0A438E865_VITVI|nr:Retrovirus-related Pol polyprotein from transposon TNT 1-94 [Vitis vinifera]
MSKVSEATNTSTVPASEALAIHALGELPNIQVTYRLNGKNYLQWSQLIKTRISATRQGDRSITEYANILKSLWQELDHYQCLKMMCSEDAALLKRFVEKERIFEFLAGLNDQDSGRMIGRAREKDGMYHPEASSNPSRIENNLPSNNRTFVPFSLIHSDIWGPSTIPNVFGARCIVKNHFGVAIKDSGLIMLVITLISPSQWSESPNPHVISIQELESQPPSQNSESSTKESIKECTKHPLYLLSHFVSYKNLSPSHISFLMSLNSISIPNTLSKALNSEEWRQAMRVDMEELEKSKTWELVDLPEGKSLVGCKWVFTVKYKETFAPVAKMNIVRILLSLAANYDWELQRYDVKNAFLHGDLEEEIYMEIPLGFRAELKGKRVCKLKKALYGLKQSPRTWFDRFTKAMMAKGTSKVKNHRTVKASEDMVVDKGMYQRLIYLSHTRSDMAYAVGGTELTLEAYTNADYAGSVVNRRSTSGYCTFVGGNLITWRSKNQTMVARSSVESEFRTMAHGV